MFEFFFVSFFYLHIFSFIYIFRLFTFFFVYIFFVYLHIFVYLHFFLFINIFFCLFKFFFKFLRLKNISRFQPFPSYFLFLSPISEIHFKSQPISFPPFILIFNTNPSSFPLSLSSTPTHLPLSSTPLPSLPQSSFSTHRHHLRTPPSSNQSPKTTPSPTNSQKPHPFQQISKNHPPLINPLKTISAFP